MRRRDLIRHLEANGCVFLREGANHTIYVNPENGRRAPVPRHNEISNEISNFTARAVCDQLEIPRP